jgi:hypothetical protein
MLKKAFGFVLLLILLFSGCLQENQGPVDCTLDAKICPDGTAVGRVAPDCEFAPCPGDERPATDTPPPKHFPDSPKPTSQSDCTDGETREATCLDGVTTYLAENCVDGKWATVMYIRNPCETIPSPEPVDPNNGGRICPSVCVPLWELKGGQCLFTDCGSGCGPDGKTTFESKAECIDRASGKTIGEACDALNPCAIGDCYKFQDEDTPICWEEDPCKKCESGECNIAESYPMQVFCK